MSALATTPDRFATFARRDLTEPEKLRRVMVTARLVSRFRCAGRTFASYRCTVCGSRVDVEARLDARRAVVGSTGRCRTANCIAWEE